MKRGGRRIKISPAKRGRIVEAQGTIPAIAKQFHVSESTVERFRAVARGKPWKGERKKLGMNRSKLYKRPDTVEDYIKLIARSEIETYFADLIAGREKARR